MSIADDRVDDFVAAGGRFCAEHQVYKWLTGSMPMAVAAMGGGSNVAVGSSVDGSAVALSGVDGGTTALKKRASVSVGTVPAPPTSDSAGGDCTGDSTVGGPSGRWRRRRRRRAGCRRTTLLHRLAVRSIVEQQVAAARSNGHCFGFTEEGTTRGTVAGIALVKAVSKRSALSWLKPTLRVSVPQSTPRRARAASMSSTNRAARCTVRHGSWSALGLRSSMQHTGQSEKHAEVVLGALVRAVASAADEQYVNVFVITSDPAMIAVLKHHQFKVTGGSVLADFEGMLLDGPLHSQHDGEVQLTGLLRRPYKIIRAKPRDLALKAQAEQRELERRAEERERARLREERRRRLSNPAHMIAEDVDCVVMDDEFDEIDTGD